MNSTSIDQVPARLLKTNKCASSQASDLSLRSTNREPTPHFFSYHDHKLYARDVEAPGCHISGHKDGEQAALEARQCLHEVPHTLEAINTMQTEGSHMQGESINLLAN